jgi:hypothetical protein
MPKTHAAPIVSLMMASKTKTKSLIFEIFLYICLILDYFTFTLLYFLFFFVL